MSEGTSGGTGTTWRVWNDLKRKEDELKWGGPQPGLGPQFDSMGRIADTAAHLGIAWGREQMGRVHRVRRALDDSGPIARRMIVERLAGIDLSAIWGILVSACQDIALYYGGSVLIGGAIGGFGGAFAGGVGALPGAAAGAAAGSYVGGGVLAMLGLKSLVEGLAQAIPEALQCYEDGFLKAWGPLRQDGRFGLDMTGRGDPSFAAFDLANGHVIMVSAILAAMTAYLTRGKGDKAVLLNEIRRSPRLGPRVASWIEENEARLRRHPALQSRRTGALPRDEASPPPPRRTQPRGGERDTQRPAGMPAKQVPCFTTKGLPQGKVPEFDRQLAGQEAGINSMTVDEYIKGREAFQCGDAVRSSCVASAARDAFKANLKRRLRLEYRARGFSSGDAEYAAAEETARRMNALAALHNPDMVAGGKDMIGDFGDRNINSRIGAQWNKRGRVAELDRAASEIPEPLRNSTKMNAKLERCK
jgi:hypothetical protein